MKLDWVATVAMGGRGARGMIILFDGGIFGRC